MRREKSYTYGLPNGQGPAVQYVPLQLADQTVARVRGWIGNFGSSNVYLFEGRLTLAEAQGRLGAGDGRIDGIALSGTGIVDWELDEDTRTLTIFYEAVNSSGQTETVSLIVTECDRNE